MSPLGPLRGLLSGLRTYLHPSTSEVDRETIRCLLRENACLRDHIAVLRQARSTAEASFLDELAEEIAREKHAEVVLRANRHNGLVAQDAWLPAPHWEEFRTTVIGHCRAQARLIMGYPPIARLIAEKALREIKARQAVLDHEQTTRLLNDQRRYREQGGAP